MSKCINDCSNEAVGRSKYCGKTCRALYSKRNRNKAQPISATVPGNDFVRVFESTVYGRPAVQWHVDKFETRPEPLDVTDQPHSGGRGRYTRQDGTVYQFDCRGHSFECVHPFKDRHGNEHLAIYKDSAEVRACYEEVQA